MKANCGGRQAEPQAQRFSREMRPRRRRRVARKSVATETRSGRKRSREKKRNFENGILSDDPALVEPLVEQFDSVWRGAFCRDCGRRDFCGNPVV